MMLDTNVVIDLHEEDTQWHGWSLDVVARAVDAGVSASAIIVGELASRAGTRSEILEMLAGFDIEVEALHADAAYRAGVAQAAYRRAGGGRERLLADFLIGAHASATGRPLITRDARRYRTYFPELELITPESHP